MLELGNLDEKELIKLDNGGFNILMAASVYGYYELVKTLLSFKSVQIEINKVDNKGMSALDYARQSLFQTALVCNPTALFGVEQYTNFFGSSEYYSQEPSPYEKIEELLLKYGAKNDTENFKKLYINGCPHIKPKNKKLILKSKDPLKELIKLQHDEFAEYIILVLGGDESSKKIKKKKKRRQ